MMGFEELQRLTARPPLYQRGGDDLWTDRHISKKMLEAHLHPEWEAASRSHAFMARSLDWLTRIFTAADCGRLLDLGCGPGLYSQPLAARGFAVTGVDISARSLAYARKQAEKSGLHIDYQGQDYLSMDYCHDFDGAMLVYCDFGALTSVEARLLIKLVHRALRPGGLWILDVFTPHHRHPDEDGKKTWGIESQGFWSAEPHIYGSETFYYPQAEAYLDQTLILPATGPHKLFRIWETVFTKERLEAMFNGTGFSATGWYGDVAGGPISAHDTTLAVVLKKD